MPMISYLINLLASPSINNVGNNECPVVAYCLNPLLCIRTTLRSHLVKTTLSSIFLTLCLVTFMAPSASAQFYVFSEGDLTGEVAPNFTLPTTHRKSISFAEYRGDSSAIIYFWAVWCPNCGAYLKDLDKRRPQFSKEEIRVISVNIGDPKKQVEKYLKKHKIELEVFLDVKGEVESAYQLYGVPTFYFVNREGKITAVRHRLPKDYHTFFSNQ